MVKRVTGAHVLLIFYVIGDVDIERDGLQDKIAAEKP
jgi:hypothetical protein